jgi:hypothetical protein
MVPNASRLDSFRLLPDPSVQQIQADTRSLITETASKVASSRTLRHAAQVAQKATYQRCDESRTFLAEQRRQLLQLEEFCGGLGLRLSQDVGLSTP